MSRDRYLEPVSPLNPRLSVLSWVDDEDDEDDDATNDVRLQGFLGFGSFFKIFGISNFAMVLQQSCSACGRNGRASDTLIWLVLILCSAARRRDSFYLAVWLARGGGLPLHWRYIRIGRSSI